MGHLHTTKSQSSNIYWVSNVCKTLKGKKRGGGAEALAMQEFSNQVREMGKEGLKDTFLWQRENLIWPESLKWLPQK